MHPRRQKERITCVECSVVGGSVGVPFHDPFFFFFLTAAAAGPGASAKPVTRTSSPWGLPTACRGLARLDL